MGKIKRPKDTNQLAKSIVDVAVGEVTETPASYASEFARMGGLKGGKARAAKLSAERRSEIAKKAARKRWERK